MRNEKFEKLLQFKKFLHRLENQVKTRKFFLLSKGKRKELIQRLERLKRQLSALIPDFHISKLFAASSLVLGLVSYQSVQAQSFGPQSQNPFGLTPILNNESKPEFADIDADGDFDMFAAGSYGNFYFYENIGSDTVPNFGSQQINPFSLAPPISYTYYMQLAAGDLDGDGDIDILVGESYGDFYYFQNIGSDTIPNYDVSVVNPFGLIGGFSAELKPELVDIDLDGDLDLFVGQSEYSEIYFFENRGSDTLPLFDTLVINPFGLTSVPEEYPSPSAGDIDKDGDFDLLVGNNYGDYYYFENIGSDSFPSFDIFQLNPFGITPVMGYGSYAGPALVDLDADGDLDLMAGEGGGEFFYYEHLDSVITANFTLNEQTEMKLYPNPAQSRFIIEVNAMHGFENGYVSVTNYLGQKLLQKQLPSVSTHWKYEVDVSGWTKGIYFVQVKQGDFPPINRKIILQN